MLFDFKEVNCLLEIIRDFSCQNQHTCLFTVGSFYSTLKRLLIISVFLWYTIKRGDCMVERKIYMDKIKKLQDQKNF